MKRPLCFAALVFLTAVWILQRLMPPGIPSFASCDRRQVCIRGVVSSKERKQKGGDEEVLLTVSHVRSDLPGAGTKDRVLVHGGPEADTVPVGSPVTAEGNLSCFPEATNHGEFDSRQYYHILHYAYQIRNAKITQTGPSRDLLGERLYRFRRKSADILDNCLPGKDAAVMKAVLLGEKGFLDDDLKDLYAGSGIIHVLAISGLHISLLGAGLYSLLRKIAVPLPESTGKGGLVLCIPPPFAGTLAVLVMLLYGKMTGMSVSALRAIFMFAIRMGALALGRTYDLLTALSAAGILLILQEPAFLDHPGFLFSFGAVMGIALLSDLLPGRVGKAFCVPLMTLPVSLRSYGTFPVFSVLLNLAVIPLMGMAVTGGMAALILGAFFVPAGRAAGIAVRIVLYFYYAACSIQKGIPGNTCVCGFRPLWQAGVYLLLLLIPAAFRKAYPKVLRCVWISACVFFLTADLSYGLSIHFMDVGQGDGILICAGGRNILVDCGSSDQKHLYKYRLLPLLQYYGVQKIDCAILSHEDTDHCSALAELLEDTESPVRVRRLLLPDIAEEERGENYARLESAAKAAGIPVFHTAAGDEIHLGGADLYVLHPKRKGTYLSANEGSCVVGLRYGRFSALLTGDLEGEGELALIRYLKQEENAFSNAGKDGTIRLTCLKAAHHGSSGSTCDAFLELADADAAVIMAGRNNPYGHPHRALLERLERDGTPREKILCTKDCGEITVWTDGKHMKTAPFLPAVPVEKTIILE